MPKEEKYTKRNFQNRGIGQYVGEGKKRKYEVDEDKGLSTNLPLPNILRIETLDGNARERYLSSVQRIGDNLRRNVYQRMGQDGESIFYGFLIGGGETEFDLGIEWNDRSGDATILGELKGLATLIPGLGSIVSGAKKASEAIGDIGTQLVGVNASATGSATVKNFSGVQLRDYSITCGWYLPEQYHLCVKSLKTLHRMAYPKQVHTGALADVINDIGPAIKDANLGKGFTASSVETVGDVTSGVANITEVPKKLFETYKDFREAFGGNFTFNPLPVRVCVGQHMDIEPLVITGVTTKFSKETFINYVGNDEVNGRHLPIFVNTTISFRYWLNPSPDLQFTSLLGEEMFGARSVPTKSTIPKVDSDSYNEQINSYKGAKNIDMARDSVTGGRVVTNTADLLGR